MSADWRPIVVAVQSGRNRQDFCSRVLGDDSLAKDPRFACHVARVANRAACEALVTACSHSFETLRKLLAEVQIIFSSVSSVDVLGRHPQLRETQVGTTTGAATIVAPSPRWRGRAFMRGAVPGRGENSGALRREFA